MPASRALQPVQQMIRSTTLRLKAKHLNQSKDNISPGVLPGILCVSSETICSLHISLSFSSFSFIRFNILYPDESGSWVLTWRLNPRRVHYGRTAKSADRGGDTAQGTKSIHGHLALRSSRTIPLLLCVNECVCSIYPPQHVCVFLWAALCRLSRGGHQSLPYWELWSAPPCRLHFPEQPNLSQWTESCQIRADSYRSISSSQTRPRHGGRD